MSNRLAGVSPLNYQGTQASNPPNITYHRRAPIPTDWQNFSIGDFWIYSVEQPAMIRDIYVLLSLANNVADWVLIVTGSASGLLTSLQTEDGNTVTPSGGVINLFGSGPINTTGTIGPSTAIINLSTVPVSYGGTGDTSFTEYAPICGGTTATGDLQQATGGFSNSGYVLTSTGSSSLPTWQATSALGGIDTINTISPDGSGNFSITSSSSTVTITPITNGIDLEASGTFVDPITVPNGGTGDTSFTEYAPICGGTTATGDLQQATGGFSNSGYILTSTGSSSLPTWQAPIGGGANGYIFLAYNNIASGITGDGSTVTPLFSSTTVNQGSVYNTTTGVWTAPVNGIYMFLVNFVFIINNSGVLYGHSNLITSASGTWPFFGPVGSGYQPTAVSGAWTFNMIIPMSAGDTAYTNLAYTIGNGSAGGLVFSSGVGGMGSTFGGYLMATT